MGLKFHDHLIVGVELYYSFIHNDFFKIKKIDTHRLYDQFEVNGIVIAVKKMKQI